jgi:hypothetical protein
LPIRVAVYQVRKWIVFVDMIFCCPPSAAAFATGKAVSMDVECLKMPAFADNPHVI